jgi:hypothetical protein
MCKIMSFLRHQIDHDDDGAQALGEFRTLVHILDGCSGDVEIRTLHLAGGSAGFIDGIHHIEEAVAPMHEGLRIDVLVVFHEIQAALQALVNHAAVIATRQSELRFGGGA